MSSQAIESSLTENRRFEAGQGFKQHSFYTSENTQALYDKAARDHEGFWCDHAKREISWIKPFTKGMNLSNPPHFTWFDDGQLNVSANCIDRHLQANGKRTAIIFEGEKGDVRYITYRELSEQVNQFANALKSRGITKGDRVIIYMPMIPEAVVAMQACARIGAIHSVVFGGFSAEALRDRVLDTQAKIILTADGGFRGGRIVKLKDSVDTALKSGCPSVTQTIVLKRTGQPVEMKTGRDFWWNDVTAGLSTECEPEVMNAEDPLFILYTSGSTGKPKGIVHTSGGYLLGAIMTMKWVFDIHPASDVFWCTADVGWITGHSYVAYGPLAVGATLLMYEGVPTVPDAGRFWKICEEHKVTIFYTAPTAIRALMKAGDEYPQAYDLSSLRLLGTVGEPINPEAWMWYHTHIGHEKCPIVDTWWQTETGMHMIAPMPAAVDTKPGSCTRPLPGIAATIFDEEGKEITQPNQGGYLVINKPWPSMARTIWGDDARFKETYFGQFKGKAYLAGDNARRDEDGYFWIMGRVDDVLNVSGHRLGTMEIESALVAHPRIAEAAVVGMPHDIKGEAIMAFVILKGARPLHGSDPALMQELRDWVAHQIGPIAKPDEIRFADNLPKTRSGKIMRRLLRQIAKGEDITQDTSTLENADIFKQLQGRA